MILNLSNHPHENWPEKQLRAARAYGDVIDLPFPPVSPDATEEELEQTALRLLRQIGEMKPDAVLVMGEFSLVFMVVDALLNNGIPVLTAASRRVTTERPQEDGTVVKTAQFDFACFRPYRRLKSRA